MRPINKPVTGRTTPLPSADVHFQGRPGLAQGQLNLVWCRSSSEHETEVAVAFGQGDDSLAGADRDDDAGHPFDRSRSLSAANLLQPSGHGHGQHEHSRRIWWLWRQLRPGQAEGLADDDLLK